MLNSRYNGYPVHLIEDVSEFQIIKKLLNKKVYVGCDTETSGLDFYNDDIAGICISCGSGYDVKNYHGFYLPLRHIGYSKNLSIEETIKLTQFIIDNYVTMWWNRDFDATMLEKDGIVFPCVGNTHDAQCMAHLYKGDSYPALKDFAHDHLKMDVIHFSDNEAKDNNFKTTDPTVSFVYAAGDPIITVLVGRKLWSEYQYIHKIYPIDNKFAECMRRIMYSTDLYLNKDIINEMLEVNSRELAIVKNEIFSLVGYQFKLDSNVDKADALTRFVTLTAKTAKGQYRVDKEVLQGIDHPLAKLLLKYANLTKFRGTYLLKMKDFPQPFHINYQHVNVATGRMSSGGSKGNSFFAAFNIQNVPKIEIFRYLHRAPYTSSIGWVLNDNPLKVVGNILLSTEEGYVKVEDLKVGNRVLSNIGFIETKRISKETFLKPNEGCYCSLDGKNWILSEAGDGIGYTLDLGDDVYAVKTDKGWLQIRTVQKIKCKGGMRDCFVCPDGYVWISEDYSSEEMVLMANFSGEPNLINPLLAGEDIHKYVATQMFGHYDPSHRTIAKVINFACPTNECLIHTSRGLIRPQQLNGSAYNQYAEEVNVIRNEKFVGNAYRILYDNGCVESYHEDHKVQVLTKEGRVWKKVKDLLNSDEVLYCPDLIRSVMGEWYEKESDYLKHRKSDKIYDFCSEPFAYLMGLYLGDGSITGPDKGKTISWVVNSYCEPLFLSCCNMLGLNVKCSRETEKWKVFVLNNNAFVKAVEFHFGRKKNKHLADKALQEWSHNEARYFVAGLIDSDGDSAANNVCFVNTNLKLINSVAPIINALGIPTKLSKCKSSVPFWRLWLAETKNLPIQTEYRKLPKRNWSCERFASHVITDEAAEIIKSDRYKNAHFDNVLRGKSSVYPTDFDIRAAQGTLNVLTTKPISVEFIGEQECYCIEVEGHEYLTAVVSHNSNYGASGYTIGKRLGKSAQEGQEMLDRYNNTLSKLTKWKQGMEKEGQRKGVVFTYFGRPRAVWMYFNSSTPGDRAFGNRTCVNTCVQGCLPGFTRVLTDSGYKPIVDISLNDLVWNGMVWTRATVVPKGEAELVRVTTEDGNILYCDDRHKLKCMIDGEYQWVDIHDIKGKEVCINNGFAEQKYGDFIDYLMGYITGDGLCYDKFRSIRQGTRREVQIYFGAHEEQRMQKIKFELEGLGFHVGVRYKTHKPNEVESTRIELRVSDKRLIDLLKSRGMSMNCNSKTKRVPMSVWSSGAKEFIRGLFESDGCKGQKSFHMVNSELLEEVALLINQFGFPTRLSKTKTAFKLMVQSSGFEDWLYGDEFKAFTTSRISDSEGKRFLNWASTKKLTGSLKTIVSRVRRGGYCTLKFAQDQGYKPYEGYHLSRVKSVEFLGERQDMFTLATEHELHQFVTEGFISKNTGGDIIRIDHIKLWGLYDPNSKTYDEEFAENTKYAITVHDEINLFVKPHYIQQAIEKLRGLMEMQFPNWRVPLKVSPSVGVDWGHQIEVKGFDENGVIIPDCQEDLSLLCCKN